MAAPVKKPDAVRSFPKPEFTDAEAGALDFPSANSRSYNYFQPAKMRATTYEDVTFDVQPDPARHLTQGWIYGFADGEGGYPQDWTALKSSDWHRFRDPNQEWEQTIYRNNANVVRQIQQNLANAKLAKAYQNWAPGWVRFVERNLGAWMHAENGIGLHVFVACQRSAPTNMINNAIAVNSAHKMRFAQDLALYNLDLSEADIGFDGSVHRSVWHEDPAWQGVRENAERLTAIGDWAEALFATNVVYETLVGGLFRSHLVMQISARNGDYVTPSLVGTGENDFSRDLAYTRSLLSLLVRDSEHGAANVELLQTWLSEWLPVSLHAAQELQPIWSHPAERVVPFADSFAAAKDDLRSVLADLGVPEPKELSA
ncbi:aromatic/alkene monooxygenase hydroxylase subunit beta [Kineosporia babensis]|uniref:propane 2-monooxygenase n=1 Tax=Kineosporia babensis TaxID=499548 RepID=A0A9X1NAQ2_9ACTN|nr:aromatic/alkene monooxygenase hydroxylase subunit beta [Kineosporia babensis]MCD5310279.1 aromatic/alkene monooxygenase hydroxylase subunit beta [Kineosporia babensis]